MSVRFLFVLLCVLLALLAGSVLAFELYHADRVYPGAWVWGVDVGGVRPGEGVGLLEAGLGLDAPLVTLVGPERSWGVRPADLGLTLDETATLSPAFRLGREDGWLGDVLVRLWRMIDGERYPPVVVYDEPTARAYLESLAGQVDYAATDAGLVLDGTTPSVTPAAPGRRVDVDATLAALAPALGRLEPVRVPLVVVEVRPAIIDGEPARAEAETLLAEPITLMLADPLEGDPGPWLLAPEVLAGMVITRAEGESLHAVLDEGALAAGLAGMAPALVIEPTDARFHFDERTGQLEPIAASIDGRALDAAASAARLAREAAAGSRYVSLVMQTVPPRYPDTATAADLGITGLVAEGESYFIGSPSGRDHNIRLAAARFDGILVAPGETFSFNQYLGEVTAEAGYDESFITAGEQLQMGIGGGICQVSTTAFRAAFWGGFPITERWYHYQRVGYYELRGGGVGMDATVYSPQVDFKFSNDRQAPLLIETEVEDREHRLVFILYGADDGRRVEMEGPEEADVVEPGPPIYELDEEMEPGEVEKWQSAVDGLTATVVRWVYDAEGTPIYHDTFVSRYAPRRAAYHYGPGYEPPGEDYQDADER